MEQTPDRHCRYRNRRNLSIGSAMQRLELVSLRIAEDCVQVGSRTASRALWKGRKVDGLSYI
jgi:hypothetical protein